MESLNKMATGRNKLETYLYWLFTLILNNVVKFSKVILPNVFYES